MLTFVGPLNKENDVHMKAVNSPGPLRTTGSQWYKALACLYNFGPNGAKIFS